MSIKQCEHCCKPVIVPESITKEQVEGIVKSELLDICTQMPWLCSQIKELKSLMTNHVSPSESLIDQWRNCPDCASKLDKLIKQGKFVDTEEEVVSSFPWIK